MSLKPTITTPQTISNQLCRATPREVLNLSKQIAQGTISVISLERDVSLQTAVNSLPIKSVFRDHDGVAYALINLLCKRFLEGFTFSTKLNAQQIEIFTIDTLEAFEYESLDDVVLFLKMARTGKFGSAKKGIDSNLVYGDWLPQYMELKAEAREQVKARERGENIRYTEQVKRTYQQMEQRKKLERAKQYVNEITTDIDRQMLEDLILSWTKNPRTAPYVHLLKKKRLTIK